MDGVQMADSKGPGPPGRHRSDACTVSGGADAMTYMLAKDIPHLEQGIQRVRSTAPVARTETRSCSPGR